MPESVREFQRAIELNPNYATARQWYGNGCLVTMERFDEAIAEGERAIELDPLSLIVNAELGNTYFRGRQYDKAIEQLRKTLEMDQSFEFAHHILGWVYEMKGLFPEAIVEYQKALDQPGLVHALVMSGRRDEALRKLDQLKELSKQRVVLAYYIAIDYVALGQKDMAFRWLERAYHEHEDDMTILKVDPRLDPLRSDPRFTDLLRRVGLSQ